MKKYTITHVKECIDIGSENDILHTALEINGDDGMQVSDGYHTMDELYDHRITLFIALCRQMSEYYVWRSHRHADGSEFGGWFILGINKEKGKQITYHIPIERWDETHFAYTSDSAPEFDGHTSADVLERIKKL